ncbi:hypothetical protein HU675_0011485 [Bradyrhizobium septentrionale]|uniref:hypothetical protein n=1 Tax=Bradyrhizobium septentrionale TaxID=1404411 RepID=UPI0015967CE7|nr:hypothetical protein [Bradyrhizobium septentrionale]UGY27322.1 hypothetical protein HU675_0011485 [Bradyrhizobium septentrionale]
MRKFLKVYALFGGPLWLFVFAVIIVERPSQIDVAPLGAACVLLPAVPAALWLAIAAMFVPLWRSLSPGLRSGLTRIHIVMCIPWVGWFGYQIADGMSRHDPWRHIARPLWLIAAVPLGLPLMLMVVLWIVAGFRGDRTLGAIAKAHDLRSPPSNSAFNTPAREWQVESGKALTPASTAWLVVSIVFASKLWIADASSMSLYWVARLPLKRQAS